MSEQIHADKAEEQVSSDSGLLLSAEPLAGGRLSAAGDADADASDTMGDDTDAGLGDADASDSALTDADAGDDEEDEADADSTDAGADAIESESGLGGENPLGINRNRPAGGDSGDADASRDS